MRFRFAMTLDIRRSGVHPDPTSPDGPSIYDLSGASVERAERHPIGFTANPGRVDPDEWEDRR